MIPGQYETIARPPPVGLWRQEGWTSSWRSGCLFLQQPSRCPSVTHKELKISACRHDRAKQEFTADYSWSVGIQKYSTTFLPLRWGAESGRSPPKAGSSSKWLGPRSLPACGAETLNMVLRKDSFKKQQNNFNDVTSIFWKPHISNSERFHALK